MRVGAMVVAVSLVVSGGVAFALPFFSTPTALRAVDGPAWGLAAVGTF